MSTPRTQRSRGIADAAQDRRVGGDLLLGRRVRAQPLKRRPAACRCRPRRRAPSTTVRPAAGECRRSATSPSALHAPVQRVQVSNSPTAYRSRRPFGRRRRLVHERPPHPALDLLVHDELGQREARGGQRRQLGGRDRRAAARAHRGAGQQRAVDGRERGVVGGSVGVRSTGFQLDRPRIGVRRERHRVRRRRRRHRIGSGPGRTRVRRGARSHDVCAYHARP